MSAAIKEKSELSKLTLTPLKELGQWSGGGTPSKSKAEYWTSGTIPWVSPKDMKVAHIADSEDHITEDAIAGSAAKLIPAGSVLIVTRSGILSHTLPVAVSTVPVTVNQDLKALTPKNGVLPEYVAWALRGFARDILNTCTKQGTTVSSIDTTALHRFEIPIAPLDKQKSIVAEIEKQFSRLDEAVANLKRVKANLKRYKAAVLKAAVEGRLVETEAELARREGRSYETGAQLLQRILETRRSQWKGKGKYKEPAAPDTTDLPELPEGWVWGSLDGVTSKITSGSRDWSRYYDKGTSIFVLAQNVRPFAPDFTFRQFVDPPASDSSCERSRVLEGDLLTTIVRANTGQVCLVTQVPGVSYVCQSVALMRPVLMASATYINYWLNSDEHGQHYFERCMYGQGRPHLSFEQLAATPIAFPPLSEQERIVAEVDYRLSLIRAIEAQVQANLKRAERLRQSVLTDAFSGKLSRQDVRLGVAA